MTKKGFEFTYSRSGQAINCFRFLFLLFIFCLRFSPLNFSYHDARAPNKKKIPSSKFREEKGRNKLKIND